MCIKNKIIYVYKNNNRKLKCRYKNKIEYKHKNRMKSPKIKINVSLFRKPARRSGLERTGTMATGPVVSVQSGSPAGELPISVQQGGNPPIIDRVKAEDVTGAICLFSLLA